MTTQLKERPVIFTTEEVSAVLAGNKTHYRVPVLTSEQVAAGYKCCYGVASGQVIFTKDESDKSFVEDGYINVECALGSIGDRLWVQEPTYTANSWDWFYAATDSLVECQAPYSPSDLHLPFDDEYQEYTGPISAKYLPQWASRILLEITDIRIERVQDTSHDDAVAEGVYHFDIEARMRDQPLSAAQIVFSRHWDAKYQEHNIMWEDNPWVWVVEFKKVNN